MAGPEGVQQVPNGEQGAPEVGGKRQQVTVAKRWALGVGSKKQHQIAAADWQVLEVDVLKKTCVVGRKFKYKCPAECCENLLFLTELSNEQSLVLHGNLIVTPHLHINGKTSPP